MASRVENPRHLIITGPPGIGKTTVVRKTVEELRRRVKVRGFYTAEVREPSDTEGLERGQRCGFDVVLLPDGKVTAPLARVSDPHEDAADGESGVQRNRARLGRYSVLIDSFESHALPEIEPVLGDAPMVYVIDEVGKMELRSRDFESTVRRLFAHPSTSQNALVLATVPVPKGRPLSLVEELRRRKDCRVLDVTRSNRNQLATELLAHCFKVLQVDA